MRYKFSIKTINNDIITQEIIYHNYQKIWFDNSLRISLIRKQLESATKLNLKIIKTIFDKKTHIVLYKKTSDIDIHRYDGDFYIDYRKPRKGCKNCVSFLIEKRKCTWKDEALLKPVKSCGGFLEKKRVVNEKVCGKK